MIFLSLVSAAHAADRVALVIGNDNYQSVPSLNNAGRDARAVAAKLRSDPLGFEVIEGFDLDEAGMLDKITAFGEALSKPGRMGFVFYAGHGAQVTTGVGSEAGAENLLMPVDVDISTTSRMVASSVRLSDVLATLRGAGRAVSVVVLDACRDNPAMDARVRGGTRGLAPVATGSSGTLIQFSTAANKTAKDGESGGNGVYTRELLQWLDRPGLSLTDVFTEVAGAVKRTTNQEPWMSSTLGERVFLAGAGGASPVTTGLVTLRVDASLGQRKVLVHGHGLVPRQGMHLPQSEYVVQVELLGDKAESGTCRIGSLRLSGDLSLSAPTVDSFPLDESCELAFESPTETILQIGGKDRRMSWFSRAERANVLNALFVDGIRQEPVDTEMGDPLLDVWEFSNGPMRRERSVVVCMDGHRPVAISAFSEGEGSESVEFLEIFSQTDSRIGTRLIARIDEALGAEELARLYRCDSDCWCSVGDWLAKREAKRLTDIAEADSLLDGANSGDYRVQSRSAISAYLKLVETTPDVQVTLDSSVVEVEGLGSKTLWLAYSARADAWQSVWLDEQPRNRLDNSGAPIYGFGISDPNVRIALFGDSAIEDAMQYVDLCADERCWLFDPKMLRISSFFPYDALKEADRAVGVVFKQMDRQVSWSASPLAPSLGDSYLKPVIDDVRRLGGLPRVDLQIDGDADCLGTDEWRLYRESAQAAVAAFNGAAHSGGSVRWLVSVTQGGGAGCVATSTFPDHSDLGTYWAVWRDPAARGASHAWQVMSAVAALPSSGASELAQSGRGALSVAVRRTLDRDPDEATRLENPACVGDDSVDVWRIASQHSVVVDRPPNWKASATRPLLSTGSILRGVRNIDTKHLTYFRAEGERWRFVVFNLETQQATTGALVDELPRYCVIDPLKREALVMDPVCDSCTEVVRRVTW